MNIYNDNAGRCVEGSMPDTQRIWAFVFLWLMLLFVSGIKPVFAEPFPDSIDVSTLNGATGFKLQPSAASDNAQFGGTVARAGDINGDGLDDAIVGAPFDARPSGSFARGRAYIVFGRNTGFPASFDPSQLDGTNGFTVTGTFQLAERVSSAGDMNGDGIADLLISEPVASTNGYRSGRVFVVFGRETAKVGAFPSNIDVPYDLDGSNGFELRGQANDLAGSSVSEAGDINADGIDDILIGATQTPIGSVYGPGRVYVVFGKNTRRSGDFPQVVFLSDLNGTNGFVLNGVVNGERAGGIAGNLGDVNGDQIDDLIVGTEYNPRTYVVFGRNTAATGRFPAEIELSYLDGTNGFLISGVEPDSLGWTGDVNQDGVNDIALGASSNSSAHSGYGYVLFGRDTASEGNFPAEVNLATVDGVSAFAMRGSWTTGQWIAGIGDINGDGVDDLAVKRSPFEFATTYVVFGRDSSIGEMFPARIDLLSLDTASGFVINGFTKVNGYNVFANRLSRTGDLNGDLIDDFIASDNDVDPAGAAYTIFGREEIDQAGWVRCAGDLNRDGVADIVLVTAHGQVRVKGLNGKLIKEFSLGPARRVVDVELTPDYNGNGVPELVVLGAGKNIAEVRDLFTGKQLGQVTFAPNPIPVDLEVLPDHNGNRKPELALLGRGPTTAEVIDAASGQQLGSVDFSDDFRPMDLEIYPDVNRNGADELAILGDHQNLNGNDKVEIRDLRSGAKLKDIWLGSGWQVLQQVFLTDVNQNGFEEVAVLRRKNGEKRLSVQIRDSRDGRWLRSIGFDMNYPPKRLLRLADINNNGADEVVVFGQRFNGGNQKAQVKDSKSGANIGPVFFDKNFAGQDIAVCGDLNGNGSEELVLLGERPSDGKLRVFVKDAKTRGLIGSVDF